MVVSSLVGILLALCITLPPAWKWELGMRRVATGVIMLGVLSTLIVALIRRYLPMDPLLAMAAVCVLTVVLSVAVLAYRFYRDPTRTAPNRNDVVVSPADGEVIYLRKSEGGELPVASKRGRHYTLHELTKTSLRTEDAWVIGIAMSFLDVHVNRAPIAGRITLSRHFSGLFGSLKHKEMAFENERTTTVVEQENLQVAMVQIASRLVRQIASFVQEGEEVTLGQRVGVIRLGSQVDVVLPIRDDLTVTVQPGTRVSAGRSILATFDPRLTQEGEFATSLSEAEATPAR
jgi:phosphatidylserine decarboxylase